MIGKAIPVRSLGQNAPLRLMRIDALMKHCSYLWGFRMVFGKLQGHG